ncbi:MAG TPA: type II secretion system protein [Candidatus Aquilonibacter sp.]|nr:type II secretion system protein [Candidatus Aquilonibacter sp.]
MLLHFTQSKNHTHCTAFTLVEVMVSFVIFGMVTSGLVYGYLMANRMAEWSSMSLAAQSSASQGAERARAANWRPRDYPPTNGPGTMDELPPSANGGPVLTNVDYFDIPSKGSPSSTNFDMWVTNYVWVTNISSDPYLREILSDAIWRFPLTGKIYTNSIVLLRAPDQ